MRAGTMDQMTPQPRGARKERGEAAVEILVLAAGLMALVGLAVALVAHSRHAAAIHDTARHAGYAALAEATTAAGVAETAELAATASLGSDVENRLRNAWQQQLGWLATKNHNPALTDRCAQSAVVTGVALRELPLSDHGATGASNHRAVLLEFDYSCRIPAPLGLDAVLGDIVIAGQWAEMAPWMVIS